jgi:hypothetical protein
MERRKQNVIAQCRWMCGFEHARVDVQIVDWSIRVRACRLKGASLNTRAGREPDVGARGESARAKQMLRVGLAQAPRRAIQKRKRSEWIFCNAADGRSAESNICYLIA